MIKILPMFIIYTFAKKYLIITYTYKFIIKNSKKNMNRINKQKMKMKNKKMNNDKINFNNILKHLQLLIIN